MIPVIRRGRLMMLRILLPAWLIGVALLASSCARTPHNIVVRFELDDSAGVHEPGRSAAVRTVQFYVHDLELRHADGEWRSLTLTEGGDARRARVALIELAKAGDRAMISAQAADGGRASYSGIRFTLGVPFELNHANPLTASAPLDRSDMFWSWQLGYKFLRVDLADAEREWSFHLGSTGCVSASSVRPPSAPCAQPNRVRVELEGFDPMRGSIRVQVNELMHAMRSVNHESCTGGYPTIPACAAPYALTGLDSASGACPDGVCRSQRLFVARVDEQS